MGAVDGKVMDSALARRMAMTARWGQERSDARGLRHAL